MAEIRDLYNDDIKDVYSINDLDQLKKEGLMNVLANTDDYIMFEAGKDFWKMDFNTGELTQYNDFVSLRDNIKGTVVYSELDPSKNEDYGAVLYDTVMATNLEDLPKFTLNDRQDYLENTTKGMIRHSVGKEFEQSIEKNKRKSKELTHDALEPLNKPETKMFVDMADVVMETLALFYTIYNAKNKEHKKEELIKEIIKKLDNKEIDVRDVLRNRALNEEIPELKTILQEWAKNVHKMDIKTSTTADDLLNDLGEKEKGYLEEFRKFYGEKQGDEEFKRFMSKLENEEKGKEIENVVFDEKENHLTVYYKPETGDKNLFALPPHTPMTEKEVAGHLLDNPQINEAAKKLSNSNKFHTLRAEKFCNKMDKKMKGEFGEFYADDLKKSFEKSGEINPTNFFAKIMTDKDFVDEMKRDYPRASPKEYGLSMAFLNTTIEEGEHNKKVLSDKILEKMGRDTTTKPDFGIVFEMMKKVTEKIRKELSQKQNKGMGLR